MSKELTGDFRKYMDKNYLGSWDVPEGSDLVLTIDHAEQNDVQNDRGKQKKLTLHFRERDYKPMILNTTNAKRIGEVCGSTKVENWKGVRIGIYSERVTAFGGTTDALRIRPYPPREEEAICEGCGKPIKAHGEFTVNKILTMSRTKYGAGLCWECSAKMKAEQEENK